MENKRDDTKSRLQRRSFLLTLGAGSAAAAAVAAKVGGAAPEATAVVEAAAKPAGDGGVSEHMRNYYRSARI